MRSGSGKKKKKHAYASLFINQVYLIKMTGLLGRRIANTKVKRFNVLCLYSVNKYVFALKA